MTVWRQVFGRRDFRSEMIASSVNAEAEVSAWSAAIFRSRMSAEGR
jgi:hypothetical protein